MSYIGNTNTTQAFTPAIDYFSGNASTTAFTLSRPVASVAQVQVNISNVPQNPSTAYTVNGNTITFTSAPPSGTNNIYVYYTSPITQVIAPSQGTVAPTQIDDSYALWNKSGSDVNYTAGNVGIGTSSPNYSLEVNKSGGATIYSISDTSANIGAFRYSNDTGQAIVVTRKARGTQASPSAVQTNDVIGQWVSQAYGGTNWRNIATIETRISNYTSDTNISSFITFSTNNASTTVSERMRIDSSGNLLFNSGYGSVATAYGCRAWVNFDGTAAGTFAGGTSTVSRTAGSTTATVTTTNSHGLITGNNVYALTGVVAGDYTVTVLTATTFTITTVATTVLTGASITFAVNSIRASGNVSSITDNGTGDYTVNFTTAMVDADYAAVISGVQGTGTGTTATQYMVGVAGAAGATTSSVQLYSKYCRPDTSNFIDIASVNVSIFR